MMRICKECRIDITLKHKNATFCSQKCKQRYWKKENIERYASSQAKWKNSNLEYYKQYYSNNTEQHLDSSKRWNENNPEYKKRHYQLNKVKEAIKMKLWCKNNLGKTRAYNNKGSSQCLKYLHVEEVVSL